LVPNEFAALVHKPSAREQAGVLRLAFEWHSRNLKVMIM